MKKVFLFFFLAISSALAQTPVKDIDRYRSYLTGDFDNREQVRAERKAGKQIHPEARHVNRVADAKIKGLSESHNGFYLLEESYYTYPGQPTQVKPYLFWFEETGEGKVRLHSLQLPPNLDKTTVRNDNDALFFNYTDLNESPSFKPVEYTRTPRGFYLKAPNELPGGLRFTLEETIGDGFLDVMELVEKDGKRLTPYDTPLQYKRLNR